ncbi:hypothetical protein [Bacillus sp. AFS088145]|uniref:hypothetical protein n=1 Tax=Bacillus sp. AFS088145 TaxID=2033514 RepID=UPI000BF7A9B3|nr:hypothetical protein [Bacillus sp. AFS088145]PFH92704.1 hypothetical protein COI44_00510 [Bacillus sp. AFS088145]
MSKQISRKFYLPFLIIISIIIGFAGWYEIYQYFFSERGIVRLNWHVDIEQPMHSKIILDERAPLSVDGSVYTQYTYDRKTIQKLKKKEYWIKVSNNNIKNLNQRVTEYNNSILKYPVHSIKSRQNLLENPVVFNDNCYYYVKRDKEKQYQYAIFILNPSEKKLYLLEYYF